MLPVGPRHQSRLFAPIAGIPFKMADIESGDFKTKHERPAEEAGDAADSNGSCCGWGWCCGCLSDKDTGATNGCLWFLLVALILVCTIAPSFWYLQYNQMAFDHSKYGTPAVDFHRVYGSGRHFLYLWHDFIIFPTTYQRVSFEGANALSIFADNGLPFEINIIFQYRLIPETLEHVYRTYSDNYDNQIQSIARARLKNRAVQFSADDYIFRRANISAEFAATAKAEIEAQVGVEVPLALFVVGDIQFPSQLIATNLQSAIEVQKNLVGQNQRQVDVINAITTTNLTSIAAATTRTQLDAEITANQTISNAQSVAKHQINSARGRGISYAINLLNMTSPVDEGKVIHLLQLQQQDTANVHYFLGSFTPIVGATAATGNG